MQQKRQFQKTLHPQKNLGPSPDIGFGFFQFPAVSVVRLADLRFWVSLLKTQRRAIKHTPGARHYWRPFLFCRLKCWANSTGRCCWNDGCWSGWKSAIKIYGYFSFYSIQHRKILSKVKCYSRGSWQITALFGLCSLHRLTYLYTLSLLQVISNSNITRFIYF